MTPHDASAAIRDALAGLQAPVTLVFFEQSIGCQSCGPARRLLEQIAEVAPQVRVERLNLVLDKDRAAEYGVDRVPATVIASGDRRLVRFYGAPDGYELASLLEGIQIAASGASGLSPSGRERLAALAAPVTLQVFFTPTCRYCPQMVTLASRLAAENPHVVATAIDATEYPDLVRRYNVNGVPKTIINETAEIVGAVGEGDLIEAVLQAAAPR